MAAQSASIRDRPLEPAPEARAFVAYAWATAAVSAALIVVGFATSPSAARQLGFDVALWAVVACLIGLVPVPSDRAPALAIDLPVALAGSFTFGPAVGGLVALIAAADIREFKHEISVHRSLFNRAQTALCVMAGGVAFRMLGGPGGSLSRTAFAAIVSLAVDVLLNYALVAAATSLRTRTALANVLRHMKIGPPSTFAGSYFCLGLLSLMMYEAYRYLGIWGLIGSTVPLLFARQAFAQSRRLEVADSALSSKRRAIEELSSQIAEERHDERTQIAAALHDDVLQGLYNVSLHAHVIREDLRSGRLLELDHDLPALLQASESASDLLRGVIRDLRRSTLGRAGLKETVDLLATQLADRCSAPIEVSIDVTGLTPETDLILYQVAREALTNAANYSGANSILLSLKQEAHRVILEVRDDGRGFDVLTVDTDSHFGLQLMRERVESRGGFLTVDSSHGQGTRILAVLREDSLE
jgi:signal transduction histidine kinase